MDRKSLAVELEVQLLMAIRQHAPGLRSRDLSTRCRAEREIVGKVLDIVDSRTTCVVRADKVGFSMSERYGHFGVDEPWPASLPLGTECPDQVKR